MAMTMRGQQVRQRGFALIPVVLVMVIAVALYAFYVSTTRLDWGEWDHQPIVADSAGSNVRPKISGRDQSLGGTLHRFVEECARALELPGLVCDHAVVQDDRRVPLMDATDPLCGFQMRLEKEALKDLASRYVFFFIGDSTTRRLAESFVSILTDRLPTHPVVHERIDMSRENLKVIFHWAPFCGSGSEGMGDAIRTVMNGNDEIMFSAGGRRAVIFTAFGIHDAGQARAVDQGKNESEYARGLPQDIVANESAIAAALSTCEEATSQLVQLAKLGTFRPQRAGKLQGLDRRRLGVDRDISNASGAAQSLKRKATSQGAGRSLSKDKDLPPLVFLLQNNPFVIDSERDLFLKQLHDIQDRVIQGTLTNATGQDAGDGVFVIRDRDSLYETMSCYRIDKSIHFWEPVKLVEAKLIWHLVRLVDGWRL